MTLAQLYILLEDEQSEVTSSKPYAPPQAKFSGLAALAAGRGV